MLSFQSLEVMHMIFINLFCILSHSKSITKKFRNVYLSPPPSEVLFDILFYTSLILIILETKMFKYIYKHTHISNYIMLMCMYIWSYTSIHAYICAYNIYAHHFYIYIYKPIYMHLYMLYIYICLYIL